MKVGDLVTVPFDPVYPGMGMIVAPSMRGLWMVLIDGVIYQLLERELEVVCGAG